MNIFHGVPAGRSGSPSLWSMKGRLLEISARMTGNGALKDTTLLPETSRLLDLVKHATTQAELSRLSNRPLACTLPYRARIEFDAPFVRFRITQASEALLALVGRTSPGFEVLEASCAGLQYHWRSDLVRVANEQVPLIGRFSALTESLEIVVEHLVLPVPTGSGAEILGWFIFSGDDASQAGLLDRSRIHLIRRGQRVRPAPLPKRFHRNRTGAGVTERLLTALRLRCPMLLL